MISDHAYSVLKSAIQQGRFPEGVFATSLRLYQENFEATQVANAGMTRAQIEKLLLVPTNIKSLIDQSEKEFRENSKNLLFKERTGRTIGDALWNVFLNIAANIIFVLISIGVYLSMQDTAQNALRSLGIETQSTIQQGGSQSKGLPANSVGTEQKTDGQ